MIDDEVKARENNMEFNAERIPPQNIQAEQALLGSVLLSAEALVQAQEYVYPGDFYRQAHRLIFEAMITLNEQNEAIDLITLVSYLEERGQLEQVGGPSYLAELADMAPTAAHVEHYAKIVEQRAILRRLIQASTEIISQSYDESADVQELLDDAERKIMEVSSHKKRNGFVKIEEVLHESLQQIDELYQHNSTITGLSTGYKALDQMTSGLHPDELIIVAARPGVGKTAFALNIAQNVGTRTDETVAIFSLEMGAIQLVNRMLCAEGLIDAGRMRNGQLLQEEYEKLIIAMASLSKANIFIDDTPGIRMSEIRAKARRLMKEQGKLGLIIIDYLQLIEGSGRESRQQEVSEISRQLKKLSKELQVPVIALSQLSRGVEHRQDKRPILSDLRESGAIEQDADIVAFLYREDYYRPEEDEGGNIPERETSDAIEVIIEKNRSGERGTVELLFIKHFNKFSSITRYDKNDIPPERH